MDSASVLITSLLSCFTWTSALIVPRRGIWMSYWLCFTLQSGNMDVGLAVFYFAVAVTNLSVPMCCTDHGLTHFLRVQTERKYTCLSLVSFEDIGSCACHSRCAGLVGHQWESCVVDSDVGSWASFKGHVLWHMGLLFRGMYCQTMAWIFSFYFLFYSQHKWSEDRPLFLLNLEYLSLFSEKQKRSWMTTGKSSIKTKPLDFSQSFTILSSSFLKAAMQAH